MNHPAPVKGQKHNGIFSNSTRKLAININSLQNTMKTACSSHAFATIDRHSENTG
jgi:hypothetical protein